MRGKANIIRRASMKNPNGSIRLTDCSLVLPVGLSDIIEDAMMDGFRGCRTDYQRDGARGSDFLLRHRADLFLDHLVLICSLHAREVNDF